MMKKHKDEWLFSNCGSGFVCVLLCVLVGGARAQTGNGTTPAIEVNAVNTLFREWNIAAPTNWNTSGGDPCTGAAVDATNFDSNDYNPGLKCKCNGTVCHITQLKIYAMDATGPIPDELWSLTYLTNLNLGQNYLTGPLSSSIGNLTSMQYLTFGINALSGELPKELGLLTGLIVLGFGTNNFSGPLPSELGSLSKLEQLYFDSAGVSGPIPTTFAALRNLQTVWASDNALNGSIPSFIGSWSKLTVLRLEGNSFSGPIPSTLSNLSSLTDLRISDVSNASSSSLAFVSNLTSLSTLSLRNNNISDSIPSNIGNHSSLAQLDLSFNNISGTIPASLFNLSSLSYLFLGNNKLTGTLPAQKSSSLLYIDLSYNQLSGSFPSWISQQNVQINLVANNFTIQSSNNSVLASGLNCLQGNFPCYRNAPIYSDFSIKCGGPEIKSSESITYEKDTFTLGAAVYNVTDSQRWAVSNVGRFADNNNASRYTYSTTSQISGSLDSEIYQTARISPSSLRYYGLGLENGNYTVTLKFAEIAIENSATWKSLGRRAFNIYIQGNLMTKDFDIRKEAGGASLKAVSKVYTAQVSENYLEIHLFWAGKGTCCVPGQGTYGPLVSAISATPDFNPTVSNRASGGSSSNTALIIGIVVPIAVISLLSIFAIYWVIQRRKRARAKDDEEFLGMDAKPYTFTYAELRSATDDFQPGNKLGEGGFGPVYKGKLTDGRVVAVKQLSVASHQGKSQFVAEIATISAVQHRNLVKLYGCCIEGEKRLLVYEYLENKSLDQALFGNSNLSLDWQTRFDICLGVARGLSYLHEESRIRIVHRDVKASNILLDSDLNPKISDFGLAKLYDDKKTHISTRVAGTIGYLAPEYAMRGHLTEKADVFGFGVVALELVAGRANSDQSLDEDRIYLLEWAWNLHESKREVDLVDDDLSEFNEEEVKRVIGIALLCTQTAPGLRPPMSRVVAMLSGDIEVSDVTSRPGYLTDWKFNDDTTTFLTSSTDEKNAGYSNFSSATGTSMEVNAYANDSGRILDEIIGQGR